MLTQLLIRDTGQNLRTSIYTLYSHLYTKASRNENVTILHANYLFPYITYASMGHIVA
jgi:hypothetical protein